MAQWMNMSTVKDAVTAYEKFLSAGDDRVQNYFLMNSPVPMVLICVGYTFFVTHWGPQWMASRKPFDLKLIIVIYNIFQVIFNGILFCWSIDIWWRYHGLGLGCYPIKFAFEQKPGDMYWGSKLCHLYFINKVIDLLDTVFFVLKKKNDKITVLHVFHHSTMVFSVWFGVKFVPGGNHAFFGLPNLFVHIWMYLYYLVAILGPQYQKYIWWKRHLTEMQLIQFGMVGLYMGYSSYACNNNKYFTTWIIVLDIAFIFLFVNFYIKAYKRQQSRKDLAFNNGHKKIKST